MKRRTKSIICIEETFNDKSQFVSKSADVYRRELRVDSVEDMVNKVIRRLCGRLIQNLYIIGHGSPGYQSVGNGDIVRILNGKSLALRTDQFSLHGEDIEEQLRRLQGRFALDGKLVLGGCRVAKDRGPELMKRISILLNNVAVEASEAKQYPPEGMEGIVLRCIGNSICTVNASGICADDED